MIEAQLGCVEEGAGESQGRPSRSVDDVPDEWMTDRCQVHPNLMRPPSLQSARQERDVCLVYLAPERGKLTAVSFRPTQEFDPITWTGKVRTLG